MKERFLILACDAGKFSELAVELSDEHRQVEVASYHDLAMWISGEDTLITVFPTGVDLREYKKILVLSTSPSHRENYIFSAVACYARKYNIEMVDDEFTTIDGKLYSMWRFWETGVKVPKTAFGPIEFLGAALNEFGGTAVLKAVDGTKGRDTYLVHSEKEIRKIMKKRADLRFILQDFVPNNGDYRVIVINFKPKMVIYRSANGKDFRNNTSLGGKATLIPLKEVDPEVLELATEAAKVLNIKIAGADVIENRNTNERSVLEVNRTPQLATGAFVDEKLAILRDLV